MEARMDYDDINVNVEVERVAEACIKNMLRLRAPRNAAIRPHRQLIRVSLSEIVHAMQVIEQTDKELVGA